MQHLLQRHAASALPPGVSMLVLAPTRELVLQLSRVAHSLLERTGSAVRSSFVTGGFPMSEDIARLRADAPHVLFGTPGRLTQHLQDTPNFVRALSSVELVVLDEADRLLDPQFLHQTDYIYRCLPGTPRPRTVLCSATFSEPVRRFAARALRAGLETEDLPAAAAHEVAAGPSMSAEAAGCSDAHAPASDRQLEVASPVDQVLIRYQPKDFLSVLLAVLGQELHDPTGEPRRVLAIFPTVRWLQFVYTLLKHRCEVPGLYALHRDLSSDKRRARVALFSKGAPPIRGVLFATDLAARGIDFDVHAVVQVGPPFRRDQYVHRAGRTGRMTAHGRSLLLLHDLEEAAVLAELAGLDMREEPAPCLTSGGEWLAALPEDSLSKLAGWWHEPHLSASGDLFFAAIIGFYLEKRAAYRLSAEDVVRLAAAFLRSTGLPEERGLPAVPSGLARKIQDEDELLGIRAATVRERWELLSALPSYPGFRSQARAAESRPRSVPMRDE